jgi:hypothetical protein
LVPDDPPAPCEDKSPSPILSSPSSGYGLNWLFTKESEGTCAPWAEPSLTYPSLEHEPVTLEAIAEEAEQTLQQFAEGGGPDWLTAYENITLPWPNMLWPSPEDHVTITYESRGISPAELGDLPMITEMWEWIRGYERELQTLRVIQGHVDMQQFIEDIIRENPGIFTDPEFAAQARVKLAEDPCREILQAILAAAALHVAPPVMLHSPFPLPVPPPPEPTPITDTEMSAGEEEDVEDGATTPASSITLEWTRNAVKFFDALEAAPKGIEPNSDLSALGWHVTEGGWHIDVPKGKGWGKVPTKFHRFYIHPWSAEPTVDAAEGENMGIYGDKLHAEPQDDVPEALSLNDVEAFAGPNTYFDGAKQRALWSMGDYGVAADHWRLTSCPLMEAMLHQQEMWVLRLEGMARLEWQNYQQVKQNLEWDQHTIKEQLHTARIMERACPYLKRDNVKGEKFIPPAKTRGVHNKDIQR